MDGGTSNEYWSLQCEGDEGENSTDDLERGKGFYGPVEGLGGEVEEDLGPDECLNSRE